MSEPKFNDDYISNLMSIEDEQIRLLQRKAQSLKAELDKTNLQIDNSSHKNYLFEKSPKISKIENNNILKSNFAKNNFIQNITKKHVLFLSSVILLVLSVNFIDGQYSLFDSESKEPLMMTSKFVIENLRGDTIDTLKSWRLLPGELLNVNILNDDILTAEQQDAVRKVIMSTDSVELDDFMVNRGFQGSESTYFLGWAGAMSTAKETDTVFTIPSDFTIIHSSNGEGNIVIKFSNLIDTDGFSGYTRSVLDNGEILKSYITIYNVDELEASELATILRHEFGHALGLGHSTDPEDLMAPTILTDFPYISECNVDAMVLLYDGNESSQAVCEK
jgi:hypothetical protein